ncbi:hypothetical protein [Kitasatospora sp. NPDC092286]|uniref:hypothetical protein n=1 Tax=Kitasatospora sp. NPDC092286 TaxID=3364087 RepID=UPI0038200C41
MTVRKAAGDSCSFTEGHSGYSAVPPAVTEPAGGHHGVPRHPGVAELAAAIANRG